MNKLRNLLLALSLVTLTATAQEVRDYELEMPSSEEQDAIMKNTDEPGDEATEWLWSERLQEDPNCQQLDTDPEFDDEVYIERLRSLPMEVELPYNKIVRSYIDRYTKRSRTQVRRLLGAMNFYTPIFERELDKAGAPLELKYLPVIESALKPEATSPVGAAGLWQFMASTGRQYKLRIDSRVDERRDIVKSSVAAARLLMDLYKKYNDWALVLAAYNCGPGNVNKAMSRAGGKRDFWAIYNYLPKETRGYVPAFIAATYVMNFYCEHGICPLEAKYPPNWDTVHVERDLSMRQVSELLGIGLPELKALNPQYKTDIIPGYSGNCVLVLPESLAPEFASYGSDIYKHRASELLQRRTTVEVGGGRGNYNEPDDNRNITASTTSTRTEQPAENTGRRTRSSFRNHRQDNEERTEARTTAPASNPRQDPTRQESTISEAGVRTLNRSIRDDGEEATISEQNDDNSNSRTAFADDASIKPVETNTNRRKTNAKVDPNRGYTSSSRYESNSSNRTNYSNSSRNNSRQSNSGSNTRNATLTSAAQASNVRTTTTETGARIRRDRTSSATTATKKEEKPAATPKNSTRSAAPKAAEQPRTVSTTKPTTSTTPKQETRSSRRTNTNKRNTSTKTEAPKQSTSKKPETTKKEEPSKKAETTTTKPTPRQTATSKRTATNKAATPNNKTTATNKQTATKQPKKAATKTEAKTTSKPDVNNNTNNKKANNKTTAKSQPSATSKPTTNSKAATKTAAKREASTGKQATTKAENTRQTATTKPAATNKPTSKPATTSKPTTLAKSASVKPAVKKGGTNVGKSSGKSGSSK